MAMQVNGKTAIVTGSGSGINFCFAKLLLEKQCNVIFADIALRPEAQKIVDKYSKSSPGQARAVFVETNVADWAQLDRMFKVATDEFGGADIVCPGAGVFEPPFSNFWQPPGSPPSLDDPASSRYAIIDINITHPIRTTQLAIAHFLENNKPGVVTICSSIAGQISFFPCPMYCASKHAINGFVRSLAPLETPTPGIPRIRVNAVAPGYIKTPLWTEHDEKLKMVNEKAVKWVTPEFVAEAMMELVERDENVGGTVLEVTKDNLRRVQAFNDPGPPNGDGGEALSPEEAMEAGKKVCQTIWDVLEPRVGKAGI